VTPHQGEFRPWGIRVPIPVADFWRLWLIGFIQFLGRWIDMLAMSVYVYQNTGSAFLVSLLMVLRFLPMSLLGMVLGAIAERIERRTLLLLINLSLLAGALALAVLEHAGMLAVWHLMAASFLGGMAIAADNPGRRLMIGQVVGSERIGTAMSIDVGTSNGTRTFGPFIAGAMLAAWGIQSVFALNAAMYAVAVAVTLLIRCRNREHSPEHESILRRLAEGWAICRTNTKLMGTLLLTVYFNIFVYPYVSIVPVIGSDILHLDAAQIGILASVDGLGSLLGAMLVGAIVKQSRFQRLYVASVVAGHVTLFLFALAASAWLSGAALLAIGLAIAGFSIGQSTLIFLLTPDHARARMMGLLTVSIGVGPIGFLVLGTLADWIGPDKAAIVMSLAGLAALFFSRRYWLPLFSRVA